MVLTRVLRTHRTKKKGMDVCIFRSFRICIVVRKSNMSYYYYRKSRIYGDTRYYYRKMNMLYFSILLYYTYKHSVPQLNGFVHLWQTSGHPDGIDWQCRHQSYSQQLSYHGNVFFWTMLSFKNVIYSDMYDCFLPLLITVRPTSKATSSLSW